MTAVAQRLSLAFRLSPERGFEALRHLAFANPLYDLTLIGRSPSKARGTAPDPWPGDAEAGKALLAGQFVCAGQRAGLGPEPWTDGNGEGTRRATALHGFGWLRDLRAVGTDAARHKARDLTADWIANNRRWSETAWRADVLGERLTNWLANLTLFDNGDSGGLQAKVLASAARQSRHLVRVAASMSRDARRFLAVKGLVYAGVCLPGSETCLEQGLGLLEKESAEQILPDGGHCQRSPTLHLDVLRHLVDMRATLTAAQIEVPVSLQGAIDRMAPMLRSYRHGDGGLALFNDSNEGDAGDIDMVLAQAGARGRPHASAPHTGFHRIGARRTLVLIDVGSPPEIKGDSVSHAGTLGFEMSIGKDRVVVNCGADLSAESEWHEALRSTAAHSTLIVNDTNSTELGALGATGHRSNTVLCNRREADGNTWIESSHDGYMQNFGLTHSRHLYLTANGEELRGLDSLVGTGGETFTVRFHLHPAVRALQAGDGEAVLLKLPSGNGWRFHAAGGSLALAESVYRGRTGEARRCAQIVISGPLEGEGAVVKWRFARYAATA